MTLVLSPEPERASLDLNSEPSAIKVFAVSSFALGSAPTVARSRSSEVVGSFTGPLVLGAKAAPPTTELRKTTLTQSRSVNA